MGKFTPGPWFYFSDRDVDGKDLIGVKPNNKSDVADCSINAHRSFDERKANAMLMAAAPDLLAALILARRAVEVMRTTDMLNHDVPLYTADVVTAAILKATGEP